MPNTVEVGQVWRDNDSRIGPARYVRVERIEDGYAFCLSSYSWRNFDGSRKVRIKLLRFRANSTGYTLHSGELKQKPKLPKTVTLDAETAAMLAARFLKRSADYLTKRYLYDKDNNVLEAVLLLAAYCEASTIDGEGGV